MLPTAHVIAVAAGFAYESAMTSDKFARAIAASIARHQTRGLVDEAAGMGDVVIHGRVDLLAVAEELWTDSVREAHPVRRSWSAAFLRQAERRQATRRLDRYREQLAQRLEQGLTEAEAAIARLRLRDLG
jgi:hypothetical protein